MLEWLGAEELAYFRVQGARASARELEELAADSGSTDVPQAGDQLVARLDPASRAREGEKLELWVDPHKAQLFNPQNGAHLTSERPDHAGGASRRRKHADSLAPRVAHGISKTADPLREDRNG